MTGTGFAGMESNHARGDSSTVRAVALNLRTIGATADGAAGSVGLPGGMGAILAAAAHDLGAIGGTVVQRVDLAEGFLIPSVFFGGSDISPLKIDPCVLGDGPTPLGPVSPGFRSLHQNSAGAIIDSTTRTLSLDFDGGEVLVDLEIEVEQFPGLPHLVRVDFGGMVEVDLKGTRSFGINRSYGREFEVSEHLHPDEVDALVMGSLDLTPSDFDVYAGPGGEYFPFDLPAGFEQVGEIWTTEGGYGRGVETRANDAGFPYPANFPGGAASGGGNVTMTHRRWEDGAESTSFAMRGDADISGEFVGGGGLGGAVTLTMTDLTAPDGQVYQETALSGDASTLGRLRVAQRFGAVDGVMTAEVDGPGWNRTLSIGQVVGVDDQVVTITTESGSGGSGALAVEGRKLGAEYEHGWSTSEVHLVDQYIGNDDPVVYGRELPHADYPPYGIINPERHEGDCEVFLPIINNPPEASEPADTTEPTEIFLPIVGNGTEPSPEPRLIEDMPPVSQPKAPPYLSDPVMQSSPPAEPPTWTVEDGENMWYKAEELAADANGGEQASIEEVKEIWEEIKDLNTDALVHDGNHDLIFEDQEFQIPSGPAADETFSWPTPQ